MFRKWILYNTKIKGLSFKFYFDTKKAFITLDLEDDLENRVNCWEKLIALKSILHDEYLPDAIYQELLLANAINLLSFDISQQDKVQVSVSGNVGWLDFTHGITFANAVRKQCSKYPELWPQGLLQMACFNGRNAGFTNEEIDLVTIDLTLTEYSGLNLLEIMRNEFAGIPCIVISGKPASSMAEKCKKLGALGYVQKPCSMRDLMTLVQSILSGRWKYDSSVWRCWARARDCQTFMPYDEWNDWGRESGGNRN